MDNETLASEMLKELKANNKRLFRGLVCVIIAWLLTIAGFLVFINQYEIASDETILTTDSVNNSGDNSINIDEDLTNGND